MSDPLSADRSAELLLWYFQDPTRYVAEGRRRNTLRPESEVVLKLALGRGVEFSAPDLSEPRTAATLKVAAAAYVTHLFFRPDATPYQTLGLDPGASPVQIKESFRLLMQLVHPDRQDADLVWPESFATEANRAYGVLRNQDSRARFDREVEARAAMARALHRAASASEASMMPVAQRPKGRRGWNSTQPILPEWLTSGVGGYAREHPATTAFGVLIVASGLAVGAMVSDGKDGLLTREIQERRVLAAPTVPAAPSRATDPPTLVASASDASTHPTSNVDSQRSLVTDSATPNASASAVRDDIAPTVGRAPDSPAIAVEAPTAPRAAPSVAPVPAAHVESVRAPAANVVAESNVPAMRAPARRETVVAAPVRAAASVESRSTPEASVSAASGPTSTASSVATAQIANAPVASAQIANAAVTSGVVANAPPAPASTPVAVTTTGARADDQVAMANTSGAASLPPATAEIEALFASFVESYERGRADAFAALFDEDADADLRHGRAAIRGEYSELFRLSEWRRMQLTRVNWKRVGDRAFAKGEITLRIGWRDGREVEQRVALDIELVRLNGRVVIAKLSQQPKN